MAPEVQIKQLFLQSGEVIDDICYIERNDRIEIDLRVVQPIRTPKSSNSLKPDPVANHVPRANYNNPNPNNSSWTKIDQHPIE